MVWRMWREWSFPRELHVGFQRLSGMTVAVLALCAAVAVHQGGAKQRAPVRHAPTPTAPMFVGDGLESGSEDEAAIVSISVTNGLEMVLHRPVSSSADETDVVVCVATNLVSTNWFPVATAVFAADETDVPVALSPERLADLGVSGTCFLRFFESGDPDGDGLETWYERLVTRTLPDEADSDHDGLPDGWEAEHGLDPTDPVDGASADSDGDGLPNGRELELGTHPLERDTDRDGLLDGEESGWIELGAELPGFDLSSASNLLSSTVHPDNGLLEVPLPFTVRAAGVHSKSAVVSVNGLVFFVDARGDLPDLHYNNESDLAQGASVSPSHAVVAAYWDDLYASASLGASVRAASFQSGTNRWFVMECADVATWSRRNDAGTRATFQIAVCETDPCTVYVRYVALSGGFDGSSAALGAQGPAGRPRLPLAYHGFGCATNGMAVAYHLGAGGDPTLRDTDGDGLDDGAELAHGTSPRQADTDADGMPDLWELEMDLDPLSTVGEAGCDADPDLDGLPNLREYEEGSHPRVRDTDGDGLPDGEECGGVTATNVLPWLAFDAGSSVDLSQAIRESEERLADWRLPTRLSLPGGFCTNATVAASGAVYFNREGFEGPEYSFPPMSLARHEDYGGSLIVAPCWGLLSATSGTSVRVGRATWNGTDYLLFEWTNVWVQTTGRTVSFQVAVPAGAADRAFVRYVGDGFNGSGVVVGVRGLDCRTAAQPCHVDWSDATEGGMSLQIVFGVGSSPECADTDDDGIGDAEEAARGLNPGLVDADHDGMDDNWELDHDLDPCDPSDAEADRDGDGLSNFDEYQYGSDPRYEDSDHDGVPDSAEILVGSDPLDPSDMGRPPPESEIREVPVSVVSGSARWRMTVKGLGPDDFREFRFVNVHMSSFWPLRIGGDTLSLRGGNSYRVTLAWMGNLDDSSGPRRYDWAARVGAAIPDALVPSTTFPDYEATRTGFLPLAAQEGLVVDNRDGLLTPLVRMEEGRGGNVPRGLSATIHVIGEPRPVFDYDRNGGIDGDDVRLAEDGRTVFRFWVNDDDDSGEENDSEHDRPGSGPDHADNRVDARGDLLDFTPVWLDFSKVVPPDMPDDLRRRLTWSLRSDCLNAVWTGLSRQSAGSFLRTDAGPLFGRRVACDLFAADVTNLCGGVAFDADFHAGSENDPDRGIVLVEGRSCGADFAVLGDFTVDDRPVRVSEGLARVRVSDVEDMYRRRSLRGAAGDPALTVDVPDVPDNQPDGTKDVDVFFLHGFNVDADAARAWGSEVFKRLWQSGSNARFHMLPWRGDYSWSPGGVFNGLHYQHNVWFAQRTAAALKRYVEAAQPDASKRVLMTQSLGNMVACEALREGLEVGRYFMFDAAVPSEAVDGTLRAETSADAPYAKYVPEDWRGYTNACWAANWHRLFAGAHGDARARMGWANRFQDALANATEVYNYYSSGDGVFAETAGVPALLDDAVHWGVDWFLWVIPYPTVETTFENHCWQKQEVLKGMATAAGTLSGGWGFNVWQEYDRQAQTWKSVRYSPEGAAAAVVGGSITNRPAFATGDAAEMRNPNASDDDVFLALAKHVPALSSPVGGNAITFGNKIENHDLNSSDYRNGWGRDKDSTYKLNWLHSDMKDMAYFYVYKLYEQLVTKGSLK
ncbi:MAG: hypothetical protein Q4G65_03820 [bacterium]|nr:hypothetical protein [bacterium]